MSGPGTPAQFDNRRLGLLETPVACVSSLALSPTQKRTERCGHCALLKATSPTARELAKSLIAAGAGPCIPHSCLESCDCVGLQGLDFFLPLLPTPQRASPVGVQGPLGCGGDPPWSVERTLSARP